MSAFYAACLLQLLLVLLSCPVAAVQHYVQLRDPPPVPDVPIQKTDALHGSVEDTRTFDEAVEPEIRPQDPGDAEENWIITFPMHGTTTNDMTEFCGLFTGYKQCHFLGHPDETGVTSVKVHTNRKKVVDALTLRSQLDVSHIETDTSYELMSHGPVKTLSREFSTSFHKAMDQANLAETRVLTNISWGLDRLDQLRGLDGYFNDSGWGLNTPVFVFDTGVDTTLPEFEHRAIPFLEAGHFGIGACFPNETFCARDYTGHGTMVAANIASRDLGVAPDSLIFAVKVTDKVGMGLFSWVVEALDFVMLTRGDRAGIIVMAFGGEGSSVYLQDAITKATEHQLTIVVAAGNNDKDACLFQPASFDEVITVAASDRNDNRAYFSNWGSCVDLFAPGTDIKSHFVSHTIKEVSGTSVSTSLVAGVIAQYIGDQFQHVRTLGHPVPFFIKEAIRTSCNSGVLHGIKEGSPNRLLYTRRLKDFLLLAGEDGKICESELVNVMHTIVPNTTHIHEFLNQADIDKDSCLQYYEFFAYANNV